MRRLFTPAWIARHVLVLVLMAGCLGLGWWQLQRASEGNSISWGYTFEWPVFAAFFGFLWWREVQLVIRKPGSGKAKREDKKPAKITPGRPIRVPVRSAMDEPDPELDAYNHFLAWLAENPGARTSDYPGYTKK